MNNIFGVVSCNMKTFSSKIQFFLALSKEKNRQRYFLLDLSRPYENQNYQTKFVLSSR